MANASNNISETTMTKAALHPAFERVRDLIDEAFSLHAGDADAVRQHVLMRVTRGMYDELIAATEAEHRRSKRIDRIMIRFIDRLQTMEHTPGLEQIVQERTAWNRREAGRSVQQGDILEQFTALLATPRPLPHVVH